MPRVSVILPNYNYARYLKERVRSILNQTMGDFELLYLDDASTDNSNELMRAFADDARVQMHCFEQNSGRVYQRWNDGARLAQGDWLWFAGADDTAHPRFLERLLSLAVQHPSAGLLHSRMATIDGAGRLLGVKWDADPDLTAHMARDYFAPGNEEALRLTAGCFLSSASAMLLRRAAFVDAGGFDTRLWSAADWHLYLRMLKTNDIAFCKEPLVCYRAHATTVTRTTRAAVRGLEDAYCTADAYLWMQEDDRFTAQMRETAYRRTKARVFDLFAAPDAVVPSHLRFAADTVYRAVQDERLLRTRDSTDRETS